MLELVDQVKRLKTERMSGNLHIVYKDVNARVSREDDFILQKLN